MELRRYNPADWFTHDGVRKKIHKIYGLGIPDVDGWRMITFTCNPHLGTEEELYHRSKDRLRRFVDFARKFLGVRHARWCWKMEFHASGYVHFHMIFEYTRKLTRDQMQRLERFWALGHLNFKRAHNVEYLFKYVLKGQSPPPWFLHYYETNEDDKPRTMSGVRFFQTSQGKARFYTGKPTPVPKSLFQNTSRVPVTVGEVLKRRRNKYIFVARDPLNRYMQSRVLPVSCTQEFSRKLGKALGSGSAVVTDDGYGVTEEFCEQVIEHHHRYKLCPLLQMNRSNPLRKAVPVTSPF